MRILYIGNHLSIRSSYPSVAESLSPRLLPEVDLHLVSQKRNKGLRMLDMLWAILRYGRKEQPVLIDVYSTWNFYYALLCGLLCSLLGISYYCVLHGGNLPERLSNSRALSRLLFGRASKLIAPSAYLQQAFRGQGYDADLVPNFIELKNYTFLLRTSLRPRLLWVRAFDAIYNPCMAIEVLAALQKDYPEAELCMVGPDKDGSMEKCKQLAEELGLEKKVRFTGRLSKEAWIALAAEYDIFINTTNIDNTPVSVIEAMALGLPVVSTNVGGLPYLLEDGKDGLLVPPANPKAMAQAVVSLLKDERRAVHQAKRAREKVEAFDVKVVVEQWKKLLLA